MSRPFVSIRSDASRASKLIGRSSVLIPMSFAAPRAVLLVDGSAAIRAAIAVRLRVLSRRRRAPSTRSRGCSWPPAMGRHVLLRDASPELRRLIALRRASSAMLRVEPRRQAEQREQPLGVEEEGELGDPAVLRAREPAAPTARSPPSGLGLYWPNAGEPFAETVGITREPLQPIPGPNHQVKMSSRPESQRSNGGIDWVASSWISAVSASMS